MPTKKAPKKSPAKKAAARKSRAKVVVKASVPKTKKAPAKKKSAKRPAPKKSTPSSGRQTYGPREQKIAGNALKLVDQAAAVLRKGIRTTADNSEKNRIAAKKRAHDLLTQATSSLTDLLKTGSSTIHNVIGRL